MFTGSAVADSPSGSGLYKSTFSEMSALNGAFRCVVFVGSIGVAGYEVKFTGSDTETAQGAEFTNATGGDATSANQTAILAKLNTNPIAIVNPLVTANTLVLINKDNYSATNSRLITFPVTTNYASATSVKLIFSVGGANVKVTGAVVASATSITVDVNIDFGSSLTFASCAGSVCDQVATCDFSLVAKYGTDQETITYGTAYIYDRAVEA